MGPKKDPSDSSTSKKYARNTIEFKKEIIEKYDSGIKIAEIGRMYGKSTSTISSIVAKKEAIKEANVAKGVDRLTKQRSQTMEEVEKLLLIWINQKQLDGDSVSEAKICEKARMLHADLIQKMPGTSDSELSDFKASKGWFQNFKRRTGIHSVIRHGKVASSDKYEAEKFVSGFQDYVEAEGFIPLQDLNCDETGLFRKNMSKRTYIIQEETPLPRHKPIQVVQSVVDLGKSMGLEMSGEDVEELVDDPRDELTTEKLQDLQIQMQQMEVEVTGQNVRTSEIKDILSKWSEIQGFLKKTHPDKAVVCRICNLFNDNALPYYRQILKRRQKQPPMDSFLVRHGATDSGPSTKRPNVPSKE